MTDWVAAVAKLRRKDSLCSAGRAEEAEQEKETSIAPTESSKYLNNCQASIFKCEFEY